MFADFKENGHGVLAFLQRRAPDLEGWYFIPEQHIVAIDDKFLSLRKEWWTGDGVAVDRWRVIFLWKDFNPARRWYGPKNMLLETQEVFTAWPKTEFLYTEEMVVGRMLVGNLHAVVDPDIPADQMYAPATKAMWDDLNYVWFDEENDGIVAVTLTEDDHTMHDFLDLITRHQKIKHGHAYCVAQKRKEFIENAMKTMSDGISTDTITMMASGVGVGKSMMAAYYTRYMMAKLKKNSKYGKSIRGKKADVIIFDDIPPEIKPKRQPSQPQHRITSVQQQGRSTRRSRR